MRQKLSVEQRRGILSIIPKKDKDLRFLKNWRPLSLLNTDYKILTKVLATRLQTALNEIVSPDQNGYIKGRFIGENVRLITDIIDYKNRTNGTGMIALLDFEKAFDTVNWHFLHHTLIAFNFGETFRRWIKTIYTDTMSCCMNNGNATTFFTLSRGVRQGCPISALLFVLVVETMANKIRSDTSISGICVGKKEIKISQLADDTTLFLRDQNALQNAFRILDNFSTCSGLKLNKSKTEIFYLGNTNHRPTDALTTSKFKALGVTFTKNTNEMAHYNVEERFKKFKSVLHLWSQRDLSLKGKITILKSLALPQLTYITNTMYVTNDFVQKVEKEIQKFVWSYKPPKIKESTLIADVHQGGLKMPHFGTMINMESINGSFRTIKNKLCQIIN